MKVRQTLVGLSIGVVSAVSILGICNIHKVNAESAVESRSDLAVCRKLAGTYLTTITDASGNFSSRGLITLTTDGTFVVSDSNQGGISGVFNPFTTAQGAWTCNGNKGFTARAIDFPLSNQGATGIGRVDYTATYDAKTETVKGQIVLTLFNDLQANPLDGGGTNGGTSNFTGQLVTAK